MQSTGLTPHKRLAFFEFNAQRHGTGQGQISVKGDPIPAGSVITGGFAAVKTGFAPTEAATLAAKVQDTDILPATAATELAAGALINLVFDGSAETMIGLTSPLLTLEFNITGADLTAGHILIILEYVVTG
ncbi:MAG: hypothetical protein GY874_17880 [Desulfobacteraceae bacterium]|nr:hypothetical protein [Desulfobacteraceae bacterium]